MFSPDQVPADETISLIVESGCQKQNAIQTAWVLTLNQLLTSNLNYFSQSLPRDLGRSAELQEA